MMIPTTATHHLRTMYAHAPSCCISNAWRRRPCCAGPSSRRLHPSETHRVGSTATAATAGDGLQAAQDTASEDIVEEEQDIVNEWRNLLATVDDEAQAPNDFMLRAAIMIARHRHPDLDEAAIYGELDRLAVAVRDTLGPGPHYPLHVCRVLSRVLYEDFGYSGATTAYYDPDNSCINMVLERRVGIPISLSLVYMEVARRVGLEMLGVNLPGHFMLKPKAEDVEILVDAFNGGEVCFLEDAEAKLSLLYGRPVKLDAGFVRRKEQVPWRAFLGRWLNNLKHLYIQQQLPEDTLTIIRMLRATRPDSIEEIRDEGLYLSQVGNFKESVDCLSLYLKLLPNAEDEEAVREIMRLANGALLNRTLQQS